MRRTTFILACFLTTVLVGALYDASAAPRDKERRNILWLNGEEKGK